MGDYYGHITTADAAATYTTEPDGKRKKFIPPEALRAVMTNFFKDRQEKKNGKKEDANDLSAIFSSAVAAFAMMFTLKSAEQINQEKSWGSKLAQSLQDFIGMSPSLENEPDVHPS